MIVFCTTGAAFLLLNTPASIAQIDLAIDTIEVTQGIEPDRSSNTGFPASSTYIQGRETIVRVYLTTTNAPLSGVDGTLNVSWFDGDLYPGSLNGPVTVGGGTNAFNWDHTLNFCFVAPTDTNFVTLSVEVDPPAGITDTDLSNNTLTFPIDLQCSGTWKIGYLPLRYRGIRGDTPRTSQIWPGEGDAFIRAALPVANLEYWGNGTMICWKDLGNKIGSTRFLAYLAADRLLRFPRPDQLYAWVPDQPLTWNSSGNRYNGRSTPKGIAGSSLAGQSFRVAYGNSEPDRYQRTFAHEMGHNLRGGGHVAGTIPWYGIDSSNRLGYGHVRANSLNKLMVGGQLTADAWVDDDEEWEIFVDHPDFDCVPAPASPLLNEATLVTGYVEASGDLTLDSVFELAGVAGTDSDKDGSLLVQLRSFAGDLIEELQVQPAVGECDGDDCDAPHPFVCVLPNQGQVIEIRDAATGALLSSRSKSPNPPNGAFTTIGDFAVVGDGSSIAWTASDPDGEGALQYLVRYSPDGSGASWIPLSFIQDEREILFEGATLPGTSGGLIRLYISDGFNTTEVDAEFVRHEDFKAPNTTILTPDSGSRLRENAGIHLSGTSYDYEDGSLTSSISWTSDRDGFLGTGRVIEPTLSAGTHFIRAETIDSDGMVGTDMIVLHLPARLYPPQSQLRLNEIYSTHAEPQSEEFIEIVGEAGYDLSSHLILVISGDSSAAGRLVAAHNLSPIGSMPSDGYAVVGDPDVPNQDAPFSGTTSLPDVSATYVLLHANNPPEVLALLGTDLDSDDDGVLETDLHALGTVHDAVSVVGTRVEDRTYFAPAVGTNADSPVPPGVFRTCTWPRGWSAEVLNFDPDESGGLPPTPGAPNDGCEDCLADFNGDGAVNTLDVIAFLSAWAAEDPEADFNDDGTINTLDVLAFLSAWTAGCE